MSDGFYIEVQRHGEGIVEGVTVVGSWSNWKCGEWFIAVKIVDFDIVKEAKPSFYLKNILPLLMKNGVVHFVGFGNRLASDPIPYHWQVLYVIYSSWIHVFELDLLKWCLWFGDLEQRLRCRCNFHALQFTPKIQSTAALIIQRMRQNSINRCFAWPSTVVQRQWKNGRTSALMTFLASMKIEE